MKKVKSGQRPAEATRKVPPAVKAAAPAAARKGAGSSAVRKRGAKVEARKPVRRRPVKAAAGAKGAAKKRGSTARRPAATPPKPAPPTLQIRKLDPMRICGDRTSVVQLFRVDEQAAVVGKAAGSRQVHLVFNDRHGWYCEHGRSCHAVSAVMRHAGIR